ncbi:MAG: SH3 domain-containing protein [Acidimicrobiales bacterium]|nr:SH3 domain-containing protein [Acidimicrobiales bacterium]
MTSRSRRRRPSPRGAVAGLLTIALAATACAGSGTDVVTQDPTTITTTDTTTSPQPTVATTAPTTTSEATPPTPPDSLPGDLIEFGPAQGDQLDVVGVAFDDVLNVRVAPGTDFEIIGTLDPDASGVTATGHNRLLSNSFWVEVEFDDQLGWVNEAFVGYLGVSQELSTDQEADGMYALGELLASTYVTQDPPSSVTLVRNAADEDEFRTTLIYDVIGIGDDSVKGFRLTIVAESDLGGTGAVSFTEQTICSRGLAPDLRCV